MTFPLERSAVAVTRRRSALSRRPICAGPMFFYIGVSGSRQSCVGGMRLVDKAGSSTMPPIVKERGSSYISGGGCGLLPSALKDFTITTLAPRSAWAHLTGQLPTALHLQSSELGSSPSHPSPTHWGDVHLCPPPLEGPGDSSGGGTTARSLVSPPWPSTTTQFACTPREAHRQLTLPGSCSSESSTSVAPWCPTCPTPSGRTNTLL